MGIKERKQREKLLVREKIMQAVNRIVAEHGWMALTIRKVAKEIEYSPPIIYEHFENKEALLHELAKEAFTHLLEAFKKDIKGIDDPLQTLQQLMRTNYFFCMKNKGYAKAMFGLDGIPRGTRHDIDAWHQIVVITKKNLSEALGITDPNDPKLFDAIHYARWLTRGVISSAVVRIHMDKKDAPFNDDERLISMMTHALKALIKGQSSSINDH
jgi:AcrR family transcriptional regulator